MTAKLRMTAKAAATEAGNAVRKTALAAAFALLASTQASALTVVEDFEFYTDGGSLTNNAGGSGFSGAWGDFANPESISTNADLTYAAIGYEVSGVGKGRVTNSVDRVTATLIRRNFAAPFTGAAQGRMIWFSTLVRCSSTGGSAGGRSGWHFNPSTTSRGSARAGFMLLGTEFRAWTNGAVRYAHTTPLAANTTHLIVGSVALKDSGVSTVKYWLNPANCTSTGTLGAAACSFDVAFNGNIVNMGVEAYNNADMDALRISDGNGDSEKAFLAVTRATPRALFGPVQFGSLAELTNNFALVNGAITNDWLSDADGNYGAGGFLSTRSSANIAHHTFMADSDGAIGGGNDVFGDCTIVYDMRRYASQQYYVGAFFLGTSSATRTPKHWLLNSNDLSANTNHVRAYYNRNMAVEGGSVQIAATNALDMSAWRHVRLDVRRVNGFKQVEVRQRIWQSAHDFRGAPLTDNTFLYDAANSHLVDGEIGFSINYTSGVAADIDNVAVYRWGGAPDWYVPKGTLVLFR